MRAGSASYLHEASHELLNPHAPFYDDEHADTIVGAARATAHPRRDELLRVVGAVGRVEALFTSERATVAPTFYACAQSMTKFLVEQIGVRQAVALFPAIKAGTWETEIGRMAAVPLSELRRRWLEKLGLAGR